jgi:hypothetical protein
MASAAAPFEAPPQVARPPRPAPGAGQPRRRPVDPDGSVGGRRTRAAARHPALAEAPTALVQPLSPVRVGALAAADTVITPPVVVDPVSSRPAARRTAPKSTPPSTGRAARVVVIMMVIMAIATGVALSVIGYMLATQGS